MSANGPSSCRGVDRCRLALPGVRVGPAHSTRPRRCPHFVLDEDCPVAVVREFLGGVFGADGHAAVLHRMSADEDEATVLSPPPFRRARDPEHVEALTGVMQRPRPTCWCAAA